MVNSYRSMPIPFFSLSPCLPHLTQRSLRRTQVIIYFWSLPQSCKLWALFQQFSQGLGKANTGPGEKHADWVCQFLIPSNWKSTFECHLPSEIITRMNSTNAGILDIHHPSTPILREKETYLPKVSPRWIIAQQMQCHAQTFRRARLMKWRRIFSIFTLIPYFRTAQKDTITFKLYWRRIWKIPFTENKNIYYQ